MREETAVRTVASAFRPQVHFTPATNWMNDPNGVVFLDGEWHLFYQYNPFGDTWGHMSWGHAVSRDLVHWRELPVALAEDERFSIFSGSVVVDAANTSGFGAPGAAALVAVYTGSERRAAGLQNQQLAWSADGAVTWTQYAGNPVLDRGLADFRDPKVFWHEASAHWVMAVALPVERQVSFYASADLKQWVHLSDFGPAGATAGIWECPDLFVLPIDGDAGNTAWVLKVDVFDGHACGSSGAQYFVGHFDGTRFVADTPPDSAARWVDHGCDFYAAASWANIPAADGRCIWIGWMSNHRYAPLTPTSPWRGAMSIPREVSLRRSARGPVLLQRPVAELEALRSDRWHLANTELDNEVRPLALSGGSGRAIEIIATFRLHSAREFGFKLRVGENEETLVGYDSAAGTVFVERSRSGLIPEPTHFPGRRQAPHACADGRLRLRILLDRCSVEVFVDDGEIVLTELIFPSPDSDGLCLFAISGTASVESLDVWALQTRGSHEN